MLQRSTLFFTVLLCLINPLQAQILNPGFELYRSDSTLANWENRTLFVIPTDSLPGECPSDSIFFRTGDAHSGNGAMELRNILCYGNLAYGQIFASDDIPAFGPSLPFTTRPTSLSFYYKNYPVGGDGFKVSLQLTDVIGLTVATMDTAVYFSAPVTAYQLVSFPLKYESSAQPERMSLSFSLIDAGGGTSAMHEGSRLLIDDLTTDAATALYDPGKNALGFSCYPTLAKEVINLVWKEPRILQHVVITVIAADGRILKTLSLQKPGSGLQINITDLPAGIYTLRVVAAEGQFNGRFVVSR